jgi:hypothetical protein
VEQAQGDAAARSIELGQTWRRPGWRRRREPTWRGKNERRGRVSIAYFFRSSFSVLLHKRGLLGARRICLVIFALISSRTLF